MPPADARRDLAYTTALVAACQRMWAAPDVAVLWRTVVDEALALIAADGVAVVTYAEGFWQTLAARPSEAAPDDSAAAAVMEMLFRQGLFQQPLSIDEPAAGASWDERADARYWWRGLKVCLGSRSVWSGMPRARRPYRRTPT